MESLEQLTSLLPTRTVLDHLQGNVADLHDGWLYIASMNDYQNVARLILNLGGIDSHAKVNATHEVYGVALHAAICTNRNAMVKLLLEHGADVNLPIPMDRKSLRLKQKTAIDLFRIYQQNVRLQKDLSTRGDPYQSPLQLAARLKNENLVRHLLLYGAHDHRQLASIDEVQTEYATKRVISNLILRNARGPALERENLD